MRMKVLMNVIKITPEYIMFVMFPISKLLERVARIRGGSTPRPNELHHVLKIRTVGHFYCHQKLVPIIFVCCFAWSLKLQLVFQYRIPCKKEMLLLLKVIFTCHKRRQFLIVVRAMINYHFYCKPVPTPIPYL